MTLKIVSHNIFIQNLIFGVFNVHAGMYSISTCTYYQKHANYAKKDIFQTSDGASRLGRGP